MVNRDPAERSKLSGVPARVFKEETGGLCGSVRWEREQWWEVGSQGPEQATCSGPWLLFRVIQKLELKRITLALCSESESLL